MGEIIASDYVINWNNTGREELRDAEEAVRRALLIDPNHALAHVAHGLIERARGEHHSALEAFSRAIELDPQFRVCLCSKGNELSLVGRPAEAPPLVEQAIRLSPHDPSIGLFYWIIGRAHFFTGQYHQAIPWLRKSVEARPNLWFNRLYLVSACALADMPEQATRALSEFNRLFPSPVYTLAVVEARESATPNDDPTVVAARNKFHEGLVRAGMADALTGKGVKYGACAIARTRVKVQKQSISQGELAMAGSDDPLGRARALYSRRVSPQRMQQMRGLLDESAAETASLNATTVLCEYLNRWNDAGPAEVAKAEAAIKEALDLNPRLFRAYFAKGFLCRTRGQHQAALDAFDETIRRAPDFARAYAQKGQELLYLGRFEEAIAEVK